MDEEEDEVESWRELIDHDEEEKGSMRPVSIVRNKPFRVRLSIRPFVLKMSGKRSGILAPIGEFSRLNGTKLARILIYGRRRKGLIPGTTTKRPEQTLNDLSIVNAQTLPENELSGKRRSIGTPERLLDL
jgi:hypothetical protein